MLRVLDASNGALNIAGICGIPFVGAAATVVDGIVKACEEAKVHKRKTKQLSSKCLQVLNMLNDQASKLEGSELQHIVDELVPILERIQKRTSRWSSYNSVMTFIRNSDIKEGIDRCDSDLDTAMKLFTINSNITLHWTQREMTDMIRNQNEEMREMRELLHQALRSETHQIIELQKAGLHAAEKMMAGGQEELRHLRETTNAQFGENIPRSTSPLPYVSDSQLYLQVQRDLIHLHRETGIPPTIKILNGEVKRVDSLPVAGGTYSDVWLGLWLGEKKVALKALRNIRASDPRAKKRFENEINMWSDLKNDHILPFYGIVTDMGQHIHMVSPWQENGNVLEYVKVKGGSSHIRLIRGAAQGLAYLHSRKIIHGNMKCANILVSAEGEACICDFGMSKVIEEVTETSVSATLTAGGNARWMAPELIEGNTPTIEADTYSFAMAILELLTGKHPFSDCKSTAAVICEIVVHRRTPSRPEIALQTWLLDGLWELMCACWQKDTFLRPSMAQMTSYIRDIEARTVS